MTHFLSCVLMVDMEGRKQSNTEKNPACSKEHLGVPNNSTIAVYHYGQYRCSLAYSLSAS